jgi:hypothetical protein
VTYLDDLSQALGAHGIRSRRRRRILLEVDDHLRSDPGAHARFGAAGEVAHAFAAELGAQASRRAATGAFAALGLAGAVYAVAFVSLSFAASSQETPMSSAVAALAFAALIVAPQVSFVAGSLAQVRAFRRRRARVLPTQELVVIRRRASVALVAGLATVGALALYGYESRAALAAWWLDFTYASTAGTSILLVLALLPIAAASRLQVHVEGDAGDVFEDVALARLCRDPWRFAKLVAAATAALVWFAAAVQGDPIDGALQGTFEGLACLAGFAALGRYLGLRR